MNNKNTKNLIPLLLACMLASSPAFAESQDNVLNAISIKKLADNKVEISLQAKDKFVKVPKVYEKSKNIYFISLPATKYNGERKLDIEPAKDMVTSFTADYIPYKTAKDSGYTRIIINTKDDTTVQVKATATSNTAELLFYILKILAGLMAIPAVAYACYVAFNKYNYNKKSLTSIFKEKLDNDEYHTDLSEIEDNIEEEIQIQEMISENIEEPAIEEVENNIEEETQIQEMISENIEEPAIEEAENNVEEEIQIQEMSSENIEEPAIEEVENNIEEETQIQEMISENIEEPAIEEVENNIEEEIQIQEINSEDIEEPAIEEVENNAEEEIQIQEMISEDIEEPAIEEVENNVEENIITPDPDEIVSDILDNEYAIEEISETISNELSQDNTNNDNLDELADINTSSADIIKSSNTDTKPELTATTINPASGCSIINSTAIDFSLLSANKPVEPDEPTDTESEDDDLLNVVEDFTFVVGETPEEPDYTEKTDIDDIDLDDISDEIEQPDISDIDQISIDDILNDIDTTDIAETTNTNAPESDNEIIEDLDNIFDNDELLTNNNSLDEILSDNAGLDDVLDTIEKDEITDNIQPNELLLNNIENINSIEEPSEISLNAQDEIQETISEDIEEPIVEEVETNIEEEIQIQENNIETDIPAEETSEEISLEEFVDTNNDNEQQSIEKETIIVDNKETIDNEEEISLEEFVDTNNDNEQQSVEEETIIVDNKETINNEEEIEIPTSFFAEKEEDLPIDTNNFFAEEVIDEDKTEEFFTRSGDTKDLNEFFSEDDVINIPEKAIDDSEPVVLDSKEISSNKQLYLLRHEGNCSLIGTIDDSVYVIKRFEQEPQKENIIMKYNETRNNQDVYIVKVDSWRALVAVSEDNMENILTLS